MQKTREMGAVGEWSYDTRVLARNLSEGTLSQADVNAFLKALPDVADKSEPFDVLGGGADGDSDSDTDVAEDDGDSGGDTQESSSGSPGQ